MAIEDVNRISPGEQYTELTPENLQDVQSRLIKIEQAFERNIDQWNAPTLLPKISDPPYWDDIRIVPGSFERPGASDPTLTSYSPGGGSATYLYGFGVNDFVCFSVQLPHTYKEGGDIYAHIHWTPGVNGVAQSGNTVGWKVDYSWANVGDNLGALTTIDLSDTCSGVDDKHEMTSDVLISGTGKGISSMIIGNIKRTDTGTDDTWAAGTLPLILELDFHFPVNTIGSETTSSK